MSPFSQEMRSDQAAVIPPASGRGRGLSGAGSIRAPAPTEARQHVVPKLGKRAPWGGGHSDLHFSQFLPEPWIHFAPGHPLGRPSLSRVPAR